MNTHAPGPEPAVAARMGVPWTRLRHGRWALELRGDEVADVRFDGVLLLRGVRPVVRDEDWNTVGVRVLTPPRADAGSPWTTELLFEAPGISYAATLTLALDDGELVVDVVGRARSAFRRNRIGLVVLHPAADSGREVTVRHTDGSSTAGRWPEAISPHQPFVDVSGFRWTRDGVTADLALDGDVFETEDQRNWTDASFKTYSTPLDRPFPVPVAVGEVCRQRLRLRASGRASARRGAGGPPDVVAVGPAVVGQLPPLALGAALHPAPSAPSNPGGSWDAVLVELTGPEADWPALLAAAAEQAEALGTALDVRLVVSDVDAVRRGVVLLGDLPVRRLGAFDLDGHLTTGPLWTALRQAVAGTGRSVELVGGTRAHFTELNRGRQQVPAEVTALTFSLTPSMHASEVPHLVDSLATQRTVVLEALRIAGGRPLHVGPVTLARRFNAVATSARPDPATEARRAVDPLQPTAFAAAWTLASVQALTVPGVASLCYFETSGPRGIVDTAGLTPAGVVLAALAARAGAPVRRVEVPAGLAALPLVTPEGPVELHLANLGPRSRTLQLTSDDEARPVVLDGWAVTRLLLD